MHRWLRQLIFPRTWVIVRLAALRHPRDATGPVTGVGRGLAAARPPSLARVWLPAPWGRSPCAPPAACCGCATSAARTSGTRHQSGTAPSASALWWRSTVSSGAALELQGNISVADAISFIKKAQAGA